MLHRLEIFVYNGASLAQDLMLALLNEKFGQNVQLHWCLRLA